ncbi:MAG: phenylalanine--tRNA ligase subunit beta [Paludibacteraceae bacterium]
MNISYNWLKNYINLKNTPEELGAILTSIGLEVGSIEKIQTVKGGLEGLVTGEVLTCTAHENSDHLHVTTVNVGNGEPLQIVCGAPNVAAGQKVIVATIGTKLYSNEDSFTIKRSKIRGIESFGMICAEDEIGMGTSHEGIMILPEDTKPGTLAKDHFNIKSDYLIEVDITPNRADAASHYGVARDLAAYFSSRNNDIILSPPPIDKFVVNNTDLTIPVKIENIEACPHYAGVTISGVSVTESPSWLKNALLTIGVRPINNVVDITNFVLHEMGQPLHAFDADKITSKEIRVKNLPEGTPFITLDGMERKLSADDLMICNGDEPMCIGGIFGGIASGVTENTRNIFLESAYFNPVNIRKTARRHGLNTDASFRFERGVDPAGTVYVLKRAALLIQEVAGGNISSEIIDKHSLEIKPFCVTLNKYKIDSLIGKPIGTDNVKKILKGLEIEIVTETDEKYKLLVPAYRVDVQRDVDVIEDILRIYGYNNVEIGDKLTSTLSYGNKPDNFKLQTLISEQLTAQGFNEVLNNSLTKSAYYLNLSDFPENQCVKILNPLSSDLNVMRQSLVFGGLENAVYNINRKNSNLKLYEFGNCYHLAGKDKETENKLSAYTENRHLGLWLTGDRNINSWAVSEQKTTVFELKAYLLNILLRLGFDIQKLTFEEFESDIYAEALSIKSKRKNTLGNFGTISSRIKNVIGIKQEVFYADLLWDTILSESVYHQTSYKELPKYPEAKRDLALVIDKRVSFAEIEEIAYRTEKRLLKEVTLFDVYEGKNIEEGKKSYAVSFTLQDEQGTLTDSIIDNILRKIQQNLENKLGAKLR